MFAIAGVSGRTGSVVADALIRAGKRVRVIVRDPVKGEPWRARGAEVAVADIADERALARALENATGAYLLSPDDPRSPDPIGSGWQVADAIARAVEASRPGHVVALSSLPARFSEGTGMCRRMHALEERLRPVPVKLTLLRAAFYLDNWAMVLGAAAAGKLPTFIRADLVSPMVATRDVGAAAARALLEGPPTGDREVIELVGPRHYSPRDLAAALSGRLGKPVEVEQLPLAAVPSVFGSFGATAAFSEQVQQLYAWMNEDHLTWPSAGARAVRGSTDADAFFTQCLGSST
jgi:uncharacterized protein YbjT (DUF2867 family)